MFKARYCTGEAEYSPNVKEMEKNSPADFVLTEVTGNTIQSTRLVMTGNSKRKYGQMPSIALASPDRILRSQK